VSPQPGRVVGLDLSLTATGIAGANWARTIKPGKLRGYERLRFLRRAILDELRGLSEGGKSVSLVVVEGPSFGSQGSSAHQVAGAWWYLTEAVDMTGIPMAIAPPSSLKKLATGVGNADKDRMMLATARRFDWFDGDNNAADALWAAAAGGFHLGTHITSVPESHLAALSGIEWPAMIGEE
jgi:crossover junction endodeoxyribonuclease RuvC